MTAVVALGSGSASVLRGVGNHPRSARVTGRAGARPVPRRSVPMGSPPCRPPGSDQRSAAPIRAQRAAGGNGDEVYSGVYGPWRVEADDVREVTAYRVGISVATVALLAASSSAFLPEDSAAHELLVRAMDPLTLVGAGGLGASLVLIHIYVAPLKAFLQLLWGLGTAGTAAIMLTQEEPAAQYVVHHPLAVLAVGPLFASVTGLAFKEGMCYGKFEAGALFFVVPSLLLGHLTGLLPGGGEKGLLAAFCVLAAVFAARKYTQPIKDDIGDKSVFEFQALPEAEQEKRLMALQAQQQRQQEDASWPPEDQQW
eukprot:jgi/Tetstr1/436542/TSEL_002697.t1